MGIGGEIFRAQKIKRTEAALNEEVLLGTEPTPRGISEIPKLQTPKVVAKRELEDDLEGEEEELISDQSVASNPSKITNSRSLPPSFTPSSRNSLRGIDSDTPGNSDDVQRIVNRTSPNDASDLFSEVQKVGEQSGRIYGMRARNGEEQEEVSEPIEKIETLELPPLARVSGNARGYTALYLMHPRARAVVEKQVEIMVRSQVNDLYLGVIIDGTFSKDFTYLKDVITRLTSDGRKLTLVLYLSNGPTMRKFATTPITALFARIDPVIFRSQIRYDLDTRERFMGVVRDAKDIFQFLKSRSEEHKGVAIVMLEDNLDRSSYRAMRSLAGDELGGLVDFIRNPCSCYEGSDSDTQGDGLEEHTLNRFDRLSNGDGFSLDGTGFLYPSEPAGKIPSTDRIKQAIEQSKARGLRYFGLWRLNWQGIKDGEPLVHPDKRVYIPSTNAEALIEIEMLRHGLG